MNNYIYGDFFKNELKDESFNLIFTDPPYQAFTNIEWDFIPVEKMWKEFNRLTEKNSGFVIFSNDLFMKDLFQYLPDNITFLYSIIWKKGNVRNYKHFTAPLKTKEFLHFFMKGKFKPNFKDGTIKERYKRTGFGNKALMRNTEYHKTKENKNTESFGMFEDIWTIPPSDNFFKHLSNLGLSPEKENILLKQHIKALNELIEDFKNGQFTDIWNIPLDKNRIHPTQKPRLFSERIKWLYREHEIKILDAFMGSGALLSAFTDATGIDKDKWKNKKELVNFIE